MSWTLFARLMFIINAVVLIFVVIAALNVGAIIPPHTEQRDASSVMVIMVLYALANFVLVWRTTTVER